MSANVGAVFDKSARIYDRARRQLVPCFDELYGAAVESVPFPPEAPLRVLDLGAGTGLLTLFLAERYRRARFTLVDASPAMLEGARDRFPAEPERFAIVVANYARDLPPGPFDAVVSALSIHHLEDEEKRALFAGVHERLAPGGVFVDADIVRGPTRELEEDYQAAWLRQVRERGVSEEDLRAAYERQSADRLSPLDDQLGWLRDAGFVHVDCWYKSWGFAVFGGRREGRP